MAEMTVETGNKTDTDESGVTEKDHGVLYIGMDLGTSRTSVACSNGVRETVASVIGYPKDVVARKHLKKDVLYGKEAFENRLSVDFYRPLAHGVIKGSDAPTDGAGEDAEMNMKAAVDLVQHAVRMATPRPDELLYGVIGCPAQASIHNRKAIIDAAKDVLDSVMICSEPFAVAYGLDRLADVLVIDIGAGTTDLCRMHGTMPEESDQITITYAGDYIDNKLSELLLERYPEAQFTIQMVKALKERHASVAEHRAPVIVELPVNGKPTEFDISAEMYEACHSVVPQFVEGLSQLIATFDPEFQDKLKDRVLLAGGGSQIKGLNDAIEAEMVKQLGHGKVIRIEEPMYGGANGALKIAHDMPADYWEKLK